MSFLKPILLFLLSRLLQHGQAADISDLSAKLQSISSAEFAGLEDLGHKIHANPEIATEEYLAHDLITGYFTDTKPDLFNVTRHAYGFPTAFKLEFSNIPEGFTGEIPTVAFLTEYDALPGVGHACGHNLIATVGLAAATFTRQAILDYDIAGRVVVYGTFDEEDKAGKSKLLDAGAFNDRNAVFLESHPTTSSAIQPMGARVNALVAIKEDSHALAVKNTYKELVVLTDIAASLPGHSSTASSVEDVGVYATNVVQTNIELGVSGLTLEALNKSIEAVYSNGTTFQRQSWTLAEDQNGVAINFTGPGGHASEGTKGALIFSAEVFRSLQAANDSLSYYLPSNTSHTELDITVSIRTRYTFELDSVKEYVVNALQQSGIPDGISYDLPYPALEVQQDLASYFINLINTDERLADSSDVWNTTAIAPASTDASFLQNPTIDQTSFKLLKADRVVFHPNFRICEPGASTCPFNHEPGFTDISDTPYAYKQTEKVARALAHTAVKLANDAEFLDSVRAITTA